MMDKLEAITMLLARQELETLKFFVEKAEECRSQHLAWDPKQPKTYKMADCNVEFERQEFERRHPALEALATLHFVSFRKTGDSNIGEKFHLTLQPAAFHRVRYERRSRPGKWWETVKLQYKETLGVAGF
jgi:hypothetical protein